MIVAVSSDEFNLGKGKVCKIKDTDRMAIVEAIKYVDKVILETSWDQKIEDVKNMMLMFLSWVMIGKVNLIS